MAKRILRPVEVQARLGIKKSKFWRDFVATGRLRLVNVGPRAVGALESDVDALIEEIIAGRDDKPRSMPPQLAKARKT